MSAYATTQPVRRAGGRAYTLRPCAGDARIDAARDRWSRRCRATRHGTKARKRWVCRCRSAEESCWLPTQYEGSPLEHSAAAPLRGNRTPRFFEVCRPPSAHRKAIEVHARLEGEAIVATIRGRAGGFNAPLPWPAAPVVSLGRYLRQVPSQELALASQTLIP